jgi:hypothetical protein
MTKIKYFSVSRPLQPQRSSLTLCPTVLVRDFGSRRSKSCPLNYESAVPMRPASLPASQTFRSLYYLTVDIYRWL